jgi:hypothetical protein
MVAARAKPQAMNCANVRDKTWRNSLRPSWNLAVPLQSPDYR